MNSILIGGEKKEKTIKRHTKLRSAVYSNSLAMTYQKMRVITTENRCDYISVTFFLNTVVINLDRWVPFFSNFEFLKSSENGWNSKIAGVFFLINRYTAFNTLILYYNDWRLPYHIIILIFIFTFHKLRLQSRFVVVVFPFFIFLLKQFLITSDNFDVG